MHNPSQDNEPGGPIPFAPPRRRWRRRRHGDGRPRKPRVRKLRFMVIMIGLATLAFVSTVFGMMMAVASDIPQIENEQQYRHDLANSFLYDDHWRPIGLFAPPNNVVIDSIGDISPSMRRAIVSIEDRRFWTNPGVDIRGIARAFMADVTGGEHQGASTIAQQFVKNALAEQGNRTVFEKLREAALAYHLTRRWSKQKILTEYLNSIYFGNGAYGIESAARVYFGREHGFRPGAGSESSTSTDASTAPRSACGDGSLPKCASVLAPWESALLAGMVASPTAFDPVLHPERGKRPSQPGAVEHAPAGLHHPRAVRQLDQEAAADRGRHPAAERAHGRAVLHELAAPTDPRGDGARPRRTGRRRRVPGVLRRPQDPHHARPQAAGRRRAGDLLRASGRRGPARARRWWRSTTRPGRFGRWSAGRSSTARRTTPSIPFNLATEGHRQPGSAFKPFTLAVALQSGYGPDSLMTSAPADFIVPNSGGKEHFIVHNFGNTYSGPITLAAATAISDNSVYARLGIDGLGKAGPGGSRGWPGGWGSAPRFEQLRDDPRRTQGGRHPARLAHAYETFAEGGRKVFNPKLGAPDQGPTGHRADQLPSSCRHKTIIDKPTYKRVLPASVAPRSSRSSPASCRPAPRRARRSPASRSPARPARPPTTVTPGSSAGRRR